MSDRERPLQGGSSGDTAPPIRSRDRDRLINRVVVAMLSGRRVRGFVYDLNTKNDEFHVFASEEASESNAEVLRVSECKAIYFVKSLTGNPDYRENKTTLSTERRLGRPFAVVFADGERIVGMVEIFHPDRRGFYLIPPDPRSNNLRIFVVIANTREVRNLDLAGSDAPPSEWTAPDPVTYPHRKRSEVVLRLLGGDETVGLAREVFLERAVLRYWKSRFLDGGRAALAEGEAPPGEGGGRKAPLDGDRRAEIVLRLRARESVHALSQEFLVPPAVLEAWREWFEEGGRRALEEMALAEAREDLAVVRSRYESLSVPGDDDGLSGFLDRISLG